MSDTAINKIIQYGTAADRIAFTPSPASGSKVLYLWYDTDAAPNTYAWNGSAWVLLNLAETKVVRKTADESVTSSTTFQDDDALTLAVSNGDVWAIEFWLFVTSASATPQFKYRLSVPGGSTIKAAQDNVLFSTASQSGNIDRFSNASGSEPATYVASTGSGGFAQLVRFPCVVIAGANGNITLQWAQNVSNGNATTVQANSVMICHKAS